MDYKSMNKFEELKYFLIELVIRVINDDNND
jgi:hypothetical protein